MDRPYDFFVISLEEMQKFAYNFVNKIFEFKNPNKATIVGLYGNLGVGKTTFVKFLAKKLGVENMIVSPTFVLMKSHRLKNKIYKTLIHIDAYRLESGEDLNRLGWQDLIKDPDNIIFIEWPERVMEVMPEHIVLRFEHVEGGEERKISFA